jgi:glycosyltransferase involved in cell wall biosynthesis
MASMAQRFENRGSGVVTTVLQSQTGSRSSGRTPGAGDGCAKTSKVTIGRSISPRLTVGVPVYNGEKFLDKTLSSILNQTFSDFQLIILDNASNDGTSEICQEYSHKDSRIEYFRQPRNVGAGPNFNALPKMASTEYFKWAAHDDLIDPRFLEVCVGGLDADPTAVLCHTGVKMIDAEDRLIGTDLRTIDGTTSMLAHKRLSELIYTPYRCFEVFGVVRRAALLRTRLHRNFRHSDGALLVELALQGKFIRIGEALFSSRQHAEQFSSTALMDGRALVSWYDPDDKRGTVMHHWRLLGAYAGNVRRHVPSSPARFQCYLRLLRWMAIRYNAKSLVLELLPRPTR